MIQRVQTIYLGIMIILLSFVTFGMEVVSFVGEQTRYTFNSYGIMEYDSTSQQLTVAHNWPFYVGLIALILLCFVCLMSYKNLKRQFKLGRSIFGIYFILTISVLLMATLGDKLLDERELTREMGVGFLLLIAGLPFSFLANVGIKRDKKLLDSLDRLR